MYLGLIVCIYSGKLAPATRYKYKKSTAMHCLAMKSEGSENLCEESTYIPWFRSNHAF